MGKHERPEGCDICQAGDDLAAALKAAGDTIQACRRHTAEIEVRLAYKRLWPTTEETSGSQ
jgi:hypothetical protein